MDAEPERFAIYAAQRGSEQAWRQLFERHFNAVYCFCAVLASGRHNLAEELTQQAFVVAAHQSRRFDPNRTNFRAWLFGIVKNRYMTIQDSERRRKQYESTSANGNSESPTQTEPDLQVHEALAKLPHHYRVVLEAKYLQGLSMKEIAAGNGASIEAVESQLRRARASFARVYEQMRTLE